MEDLMEQNHREALRLASEARRMARDGVSLEGMLDALNPSGDELIAEGLTELYQETPRR